MVKNCCKPVKSFIQKFDLFCSNQILRVKSQDKYQTCTGGMVSLILIIATIIGFSNQIIATFQRTKFQSDLQITHHNNPPLYQFTSGKDNAMMGLFLRYQNGTIIDLNNGPQLFDVILLQSYFQDGILKRNNLLELQPCSQKHFNLQAQRFQNMQANRYVCIKNNQKYYIEGRTGSKQRLAVTLSIIACVNSTFNHNKCASPTLISNMFTISKNYIVGLVYTNPLINPNLPNHLSYYFNADNTFLISQTLSTHAQISFSDYRIDSYYGILPFQQIVTQSGIVSQDHASLFHTTRKANNPILGAFTITKSSKSLYYTRTTLKISNVISYMGGLIGAFLSILIILKKYTSISLQLRIAQTVFYQNQKTNQQNQQLKQNKNDKQTNHQPNHTNNQQLNKPKIPFSVLTFIRLMWYKTLLFCNFKMKDDKIYKKIELYRQQINQQLDISNLLQRILKIQYYLSQNINNDTKFIEKAKYLYLRSLIKNQDSQNQSINQNKYNNELINCNNIVLMSKQNLLEQSIQNKKDKKDKIQIDLINSRNQLQIQDIEQSYNNIDVEYNRKDNQKVKVKSSNKQKQNIQMDNGDISRQSSYNSKNSTNFTQIKNRRQNRYNKNHMNVQNLVYQEQIQGQQ